MADLIPASNENENEDTRDARRRRMRDAVTGEEVEVEEFSFFDVEEAREAARLGIDPGVAAEQDAPRRMGPKSGLDSDPTKLSDDDLVAWYNGLIHEWTSGEDFVNDADKIDRVKVLRMAGVREITERGLVGHDDLRKVMKYLTADIVASTRPRPEDERYAEFLQRRADMRDALFGAEGPMGVEGYIRSAAHTQNMIRTETHLREQYEMIELRREAALEHFADPRFVIAVGSARGGGGAVGKDSLRDEILIDFDRRDLDTDAARARSRALADTFGDMLVARREAADSGSRVRSFLLLREAGTFLRTEHQALFDLSDRFANDPKSLEMGLAALDNVTYSASVLSEFCDNVEPARRREVYDNIRTPRGLFREARADFERRFRNDDPRAATSFAVMEAAARRILGNSRDLDAFTQEDLERGTPENTAALFMFKEETLRRHRDPIGTRLETEVTFRMNQAGKTRIQGEREVEARGVTKSGEAFLLSLSQMGQDVHVDVVDGARIRIARSEEEARAGKFIEGRLGSIDAPKLGIRTKDGKLDAGEEARDHLAALFRQYGTRGMDIRMNQDENGHNRSFSIDLPNGESLAQRMVRDGYAVPSEAGHIRREMLAKEAQANRRGLWRHGFVDRKQDWRCEAHLPELSEKDKQSALADRTSGTVARALAGNPADVHRKLSHSETKIFALPLERWSGMAGVDREVMRTAKVNPARLLDIYGNNIELLEELRARKGKLTGKEQLAHDRLTVGTGALAKALVATGHLDAEAARQNEHPLLSAKSMTLPKGLIERPVKMITQTTSNAIKAGRTVVAMSKVPRSLGNMMTWDD